MGINSIIRDGSGADYKARVGKQGQIYTTQIQPTLPSSGSSNTYRFFADYLRLNGSESGSIDLNIDGSVTEQYFSVNAKQEYDVHIMRLILYLADSTVVHNKFGAIDELVNGVDLIVQESGNITYILSEVKQFSDALIQTGIEAPFGDSATAFELTAINDANHDAWVLPFTLADYVPNGVRLGYGSTDKIEIRIKDDLTGLTYFKVRVMGYTHHEFEEN